MVRAATTGAIDFAKFDPWDAWWWKRTNWAIAELETRLLASAAQVRHSHWLAHAGRDNLTSEAREEVNAVAQRAMTDYLIAMFPWLKDTLTKDESQGWRTDMESAYRAAFGSPGEPRYEAMIAGLRDVFSKGKMTQEEQALYYHKRNAERANQQMHG